MDLALTRTPVFEVRSSKFEVERSLEESNERLEDQAVVHEPVELAPGSAEAVQFPEEDQVP
jgi:hypothetical protein